MKNISTGLLTLSLLCTSIIASPVLQASAETNNANSEEAQKIQADIDKMKQGPQDRFTLRKITIYERKLEELKKNTTISEDQKKQNYEKIKELSNDLTQKMNTGSMLNEHKDNMDDPQKIQEEINRLKEKKPNRTILKKISDLERKLEEMQAH